MTLFLFKMKISKQQRSNIIFLGIILLLIIPQTRVPIQVLLHKGLALFGTSVIDEDEREQIDAIIFKELVNGIFTEESRLYFNKVIQELKNRGCDAVVLGCTEIPLLVDPGDCPLPTLDSTRLLARAALQESLHIS